VRVLQPGRGRDLAPEALGVDREGHFTVEELEGDRPIVPEIARDVHGGHAAATQHALELVATAKGEGGYRSGH
jgi:hypothetical protein